MDSVCFVMASHTWMDGARPVRRDQNRRNQTAEELMNQGKYFRTYGSKEL